MKPRQIASDLERLVMIDQVSPVSLGIGFVGPTKVEG